MGVERQAKATPVTPEQVFLALASAWQVLTGTLPDRHVLHILHAQSALETGHWKSISNFNLGGAKKHGECDWTHFTTTERFGTTSADKYLASSKPGSEVVLVKDDGKFKTLKFSGKQSMNCFASWETLTDASRAHLDMLSRKFPKAIEQAKKGDAKAYVHELKVRGYFTASEEDYAKIVTSIAKTYEKKLANVMLPTIVML